MGKVSIECKSCGKNVEVMQRRGFKRKYCDDCSKKNKEEWSDWKENQWKLTMDDMEDEE